MPDRGYGLALAHGVTVGNTTSLLEWEQLSWELSHMTRLQVLLLYVCFCAASDMIGLGCVRLVMHAQTSTLPQFEALHTKMAKGCT